MCEKPSQTRREKAIERAMQNLVLSARSIALADPDRTHPDLHKALAQLDRARES